MIAQTFQDAFSPQWIKTHLANPTHDLIILHYIIPWQPIIERLAPFYHPHKGRSGHSRRILAPPPSSADCANSATVRESKTCKKTDTGSTLAMSPLNAS
jgi:hypothetical protein